MRTNVAYYDLEGRFLYATPSLATYVGMTPEALVGRTWFEIGVPPDVVGVLEASRRTVLETGQPVSERVSVRIRGSLREAEFLIKPVLAADGSVIGTVVTAWDAREPAERRRGRARIDRAYSILSGVDQAILRSKDPNIILSETCRIAAGIGGFELAWVGLAQGPDEDVRIVCQAGRDEGLLPALHISMRSDPTGAGVVGTSLRENRTVIVGDVKRDHHMDAWREFFDRLGYQTAAGFPIRVSGRPIGTLALYSSEASRFDAAEARLFEEVVRDVSEALTSIDLETERAASQAALAASERRYRDLFDMGPHPLAVYDRATRQFLAVNAEAVATFGYSRDDFLGMRIDQVVHPDDFAMLLDEVASVQAGSDYRPSGPWQLRRKDGSVLLAEVSTHEVEFDGRPARLVLAIDVTERRRFERQVAEAMRMEAMGQLAGGIAHDFNNLLTAVNGYADLLIGELEGDPRESAREIRRAGGRAAELTKQVLAFARGLPLSPMAVDLNVVVGGVREMLSRLIGEQIRLVVRLDPSPVVVRADPGQLEQVLVNLAVNARDAMPDGGDLEIEVRRADDTAPGSGWSGPGALLRVRDTGAGMDEATLARAFEPFFSTKEAGRGTGLGLASVHGIVVQSGGRVWAESTPGDGTSVSVLLPRLDCQPDAVFAAPLAAARVERKTILVVEDDPLVRGFAVSTLERAGHQVLVAASVPQAAVLGRGLDEPIDLLLTDLVLPGGNGRELAERLQEERPSLKVVVMSGYDALPTRNDGFHFVAKPFGADELLAAIAEAAS